MSFPGTSPNINIPMATPKDGSDIPLPGSSYEKQLEEFNTLLYEPKETKKFHLISNYKSPKQISIVFFSFYFQSLLIVYYLFDKDYSHSEDGKFSYMKFIFTSFYVTISMMVYLLLFSVFLKKFIF